MRLVCDYNTGQPLSHISLNTEIHRSQEAIERVGRQSPVKRGGLERSFDSLRSSPFAEDVLHDNKLKARLACGRGIFAGAFGEQNGNAIDDRIVIAASSAAKRRRGGFEGLTTHWADEQRQQFSGGDFGG
jgi:hypothetical protein